MDFNKLMNAYITSIFSFNLIQSLNFDYLETYIQPIIIFNSTTLRGPVLFHNLNINR